MEHSRPIATLRKQLLWSHLRIAMPAALALLIAAILINSLTDLLDEMQRENIPSVEAANLVQVGLQRSSAALQGWVALKQPEHKQLLELAWTGEIDRALQTFNNEGLGYSDSAKRNKLDQITVKLKRLRALQDWIIDVSIKPGNEPARLVLSSEFPLSKERLLAYFEPTKAQASQLINRTTRLKLRIAMAELEAALGGFVVDAQDGTISVINNSLAQIQTLVQERIIAAQAADSDTAKGINAEFELLARLADSIVASRRSPRSNVAWDTIRAHAQPLAAEITADVNELAASERSSMQLNSDTIIRATDSLAVFSTVAFLVVVLLALWLARSEALRLSAPVVRLSRAAESIGRGEFSTELPQSNTREVKKLIESFQHMRSAISESHGSLRSMAYTDDLTGLANRKAFNEALAKTSSAERIGVDGEKCSAIALIDLDHFKQINDSLGHAAGDHILCVLASRLRNCMRGSDLAARLGGDEFALILSDVRDEAEACQIIERLLEVTVEPIQYAGEVVHTSATIGLVLIDEPSCDAEDLLKRADIALYEAKDIKRGTYQRYSGDTHRKVRRTRGLIDIIANHPPGEVFAVQYQPLVNLQTREMVGVEALLHWQHSEFEVTSILEVIELMERHGHIMRVTDWILNTALETLSRWHKNGGHEISMAVNISALNLHDDNFVAMIQAALRKHNAKSKNLILEVTETMVLDEFDASLAAMDRLNALGVRFALDDFGTGYSSLMRLKEMPITELKIDRDFVADMLTDPKHAAIVDASIQLGRSIGMLVVAEGIETAEQADYLESHGCGYGQGYLFGRPAAQIVVPQVSQSKPAVQPLSANGYR